MSCKVNFNTRPYVRSHMREPRGLGSWAFGREDPRGGRDDVFFWVHGTYAEARKKARDRAKEAGICYLDVLP